MTDVPPHIEAGAKALRNDDSIYHESDWAVPTSDFYCAATACWQAAARKLLKDDEALSRLAAELWGERSVTDAERAVLASFLGVPEDTKEEQ